MRSIVALIRTIRHLTTGECLAERSYPCAADALTPPDQALVRICAPKACSSEEDGGACEIQWVVDPLPAGDRAHLLPAGEAAPHHHGQRLDARHGD